MVKIFSVLLFFVWSLSIGDQHSNAQTEIESVITQLFDGMRESSRAKVEDTFHESISLSTVTVNENETELNESSVIQFLEAIGMPKIEVWDERISDLEIRLDGELAAAWMKYTFYRGDEFSHCGVNAMKFIHTGKGWKIFSITDTRRVNSC